MVATATLAKVIKLTPELAYSNARIMGDEGMSRNDAYGFSGMYAWVLKDVIRFEKPVHYKH